MSGINPHGNNQTYPGFLGKMVNLFEFNKGLPASKLLTDKPHRDGSPLSRSRSDAPRMSSPGYSIQDKAIITELAACKKSSSVTPMKTLIAQEMSKEGETKHDSPNLVAKLMGLDSLPRQRTESATTQRTRSRGHPRSHSEIPAGYWDKKNGFSHRPNEYRDVFEVWPQSQASSPRREETAGDEKMAFVRQKFVEVKRLSMNEKHRKSKQFHDALEVLSSNKELFLECLQEPSSMFSQPLTNNLQTPETKRITILRPSKMTGKNEAANKEDHLQPTRIVVLKPSTMKADDVTPKLDLPRIVLAGADPFADVDNDENREVARAITRKMRERLERHHRDSMFSNGYVGDDSSFNKLEFEFADGNNNLSDTELASPISRHSWDYVSERVGSPYMSSSFSRASYSPESSVCREAKKRLSERWAMMSSNGICHQEQKPVRRGSSTLGEMLALSETKNDTGNNPREESSSIGEFSCRNPVPVSEEKGDELIGNNSPRSLTRSKSVPVSSTEFGNRVDECKSSTQREEIKTNKASSLKGRVSSLFFSRGKKTTKDNSQALGSKDVSSDCNETVRNHEFPGPKEPFSNKASFVNFLEKQGMLPPENESMLSKPTKSGVVGKNQDGQSPMLVLDPPFEADERAILGFRHNLEHDQDGNGSKLIGRSPPIGCIARTLSWEDPCNDTASSKETLATTTTNDEDLQEWFLFVKTLLSVANLREPSGARPEGPLDLSLRDKYADSKDRELLLHEATRRRKRSTRKLIFDRVNEALVGTEHFSGLADKLWENMRPWFSYEPVESCPEGSVDNDGLAVESLVRKEVAGEMNGGGGGGLRPEMEGLCGEIEGKLIEELVREMVLELTGRP